LQEEVVLAPRRKMCRSLDSKTCLTSILASV
jgi:hypothetical protein